MQPGDVDHAFIEAVRAERARRPQQHASSSRHDAEPSEPESDDQVRARMIAADHTRLRPHVIARLP